VLPSYLGQTLLDPYEGHPGLVGYQAEGYRVLTF